MANIWEKAISILAGNLNLGRSLSYYWFIDDFLWIRSKCEIRYYQLFNASFCVVARQIVVSFSGDLPKEVVRNMLWYYNEAVENYLYLVLHFQCYKFNRVIKSNLTSLWNSDGRSWKMIQKNFVSIKFCQQELLKHSYDISSAW